MAISNDQLVLIENIKKVFSGEAGQSILKALEQSCCKTTSFDPESSHRTAFLEGRRAVVLEILEAYEADLDTLRAGPTVNTDEV